MNRGAWQATVHGVSKELDPARQLNDNNEGLKYRMFPNLKELEIVFSNQKSCNLRESPQNLNSKIPGFLFPNILTQETGLIAKNLYFKNILR